METSSHVCSLHMAVFDDADKNRSLQTTSHMYIWKKAKTCLIVPSVCSVRLTMLILFAVCTCGCTGVWLARVLLCVSSPAGVEDALEQQREFDEHVVESKRYARLYFSCVLAVCGSLVVVLDLVWRKDCGTGGRGAARKLEIEISPLDARIVGEAC